MPDERQWPPGTPEFLMRPVRGLRRCTGCGELVITGDPHKCVGADEEGQETEETPHGHQS